MSVSINNIFFWMALWHHCIHQFHMACVEDKWPVYYFATQATLACVLKSLRQHCQTYWRVIDRVGEHFTKIETAKLDTDMGLHYNSNNHQKLDDVEITVVDFIYSHPKSAYAEKLCNKIEKDLISKLRTQVPFGMNLADVPVFSIQR